MEAASLIEYNLICGKKSKTGSSWKLHCQLIIKSNVIIRVLVLLVHPKVAMPGFPGVRGGG